MLNIDTLMITRGAAVLVSGMTRTLDKGRLWVLSGPNGTGKTSFLRAAAGLLNAAEGTVTRTPLHWISAQAIPPSPETPRQYLAFHAALAGGHINTALDPFRISTILDTPMNRLSTGWRQRVKLSRLWQAPRPLWLLDEPSDGLDAEGLETLQNIIKSHLENGGAAIIATHQPQLWPHGETIRFGEVA